MKIETISGPSVLPAGPNSTKQAELRANAIAKLTPNAQSTPVRNPNQVSPEEFSSLQRQSNQPDESRQNLTSETSEVEAPIEETKAPSEPISSQYAVLARKEKALRARDQQLRAKEAALAAREAATATPKAPEFDPSKYISRDELAKDPFSALNAVGVTYDQLTNQALNQPSAEQLAQNNYMKKLEAKLEALEQGQTKAAKNFEEQQAESYKQAVGQIRNDVRSLVHSDPTFETIKATNSISDVVELIEETFKKDGILLTAEEAANEVENYLVEEALKLSRIKKIQQRLSSASSAQKQSQAPQGGAPKQQPMKTLTNAVGAAGQLSSRERALLAFKNELKR